MRRLLPGAILTTLLIAVAVLGIVELVGDGMSAILEAFGD